MIEFLPWYEAGAQLVRCLDCGALVGSGDTETHVKWHERIETIEALAVRTGNRIEMVPMPGTVKGW